jgi:hypothetical protein
MAMRRRPAAGWNVYIDKREAAGDVFACEEDGLSVAYDSDVRNIFVVVGLRTLRIVWRYRHDCSC